MGNVGKSGAQEREFAKIHGNKCELSRMLSSPSSRHLIQTGLYNMELLSSHNAGRPMVGQNA